MKQKNIFLLILFSFGFKTVTAQENPISTGGNATGSGGTVAYTIGQAFYITQTNTNGTIAPGVQQPFEITAVTGIDGTKNINLLCSAYPNPTTDFLILKVDNNEPSTFSYHLFDMSGRLLESKIVESNETSINMSNCVPAIYFLNVTNGNNKVKTFKIIKK